MRWPRRLCGGMIRSAVDVATAAFIGGICLCVPSFVSSIDSDGERSPGILDHMVGDYGAGSFDAGNEEDRFKGLLDVPSALGKDLRHGFTKIKHEVHAHTRYSELNDASVFKYEPKGAGLLLGKLMDKPQRDFTEAREDKRHGDVIRSLANDTSRRGSEPNTRAAKARDPQL